MDFDLKTAIPILARTPAVNRGLGPPYSVLPTPYSLLPSGPSRRHCGTPRGRCRGHTSSRLAAS